MSKSNLTGSLIIGYDFSANDKGVLIVGKKTKGQATEVINAFQGKEAYDLFQKLITKETTHEETDIHN